MFLRHLLASPSLEMTSVPLWVNPRSTGGKLARSESGVLCILHESRSGCEGYLLERKCGLNSRNVCTRPQRDEARRLAFGSEDYAALDFGRVSCSAISSTTYRLRSASAGSSGASFWLASMRSSVRRNISINVRCESTLIGMTRFGAMDGRGRFYGAQLSRYERRAMGGGASVGEQPHARILMPSRAAKDIGRFWVVLAEAGKRSNAG